MSFFLIGRDPDGAVFLLSDTVSDTRQDALAELSQATADPSFDHWDAEVFVIDIAQGTPVLLVRPAQAAAPEPEVAEEPEPEVAEEPHVEAEPEPRDADDEIAQVISDLEDDEDVLVDAAYAEAVVEEAEGPGSLKEALLRTAASMEDEGIVVPDSIGPADEPDAGSEDETTESIAGESAEGSDAPDEEVAVDEPEETLPTEPQAWPWDTGSADSGFSLDALEEPSSDEGSLVKAAGDDDTMAAARPVILGAYDEPVPDAVEAADTSAGPEPTAEPEPFADVVSAPMGSESEPLDETAAEIVSEILAGGTEGASAESESDFILDLDELAASTAQEPSGYVPGESAPMTCDDCVYVETCPHTGQRAPQSCGSFQWK